jgi:hydrogenase nickel incorporation protein HypA/HybF
VHELSVCQSLMREVQRVAAENDANAVMAITVAVGPLSGVEAPLLERAFTIARAGTIAEDATFTVEVLPVTVWCSACGVETQVPVNALLCGQCGTWQVDLRSGSELLLKRVELASDAPAGVEC